jgi:hypothetical protein
MDMHTRVRYSRRVFLKLAGIAATSYALFDVTDWLTPEAARAAARSRWTIAETLTAGTFETPVLWADGPFNAVDLSWLGTSPSGAGLSFEVRVSDEGAVWSDWYALAPDTHAFDASDPRGYTTPALCSGRALQVRVTVAPGVSIDELTIGALDTTPTPGPNAMSAEAALIDGFIIPRAGWGADEALRHKNQDLKKPIIWPPEYEPIEKIIVHHTVTENNPTNPAAAIRAIYYYHAITRGWGDIGYNFVIDWHGNVYEGRFGGPNVVGGHALQYNHGSIGIALLGNFMTVAPPDDMIDSLLQTIGVRAGHVDVTTSADFIDLLAVPNLCGHGDVLSTSCPGGEVHDLIPAIRGYIAGTGPIYLDPPIRIEGVAIEECTVGPERIPQGTLLEVRLLISNTGATTLHTQGPDPGYVYGEDADFQSVGFPKIEDCYRVGLDYEGNSGVVNPYRWGFGDPLESGESREIVGYVRLQSKGKRTFTVSIVKEYVQYYIDHEFPQTVQVTTPPIARTPASSDWSVRYFPETGHNVPEPFASYWEERGGLYRFGYPLTEAFEEVSETDGRRYLTQYFERARFEWHPDYAGTDWEVQLGLLGAELVVERRAEAPFKPIAPFQSTSERHYFAETGHSLAFAFKRFWEANGGLPIFGYPISEEFEEVSETDGQTYTVQYLERNRFEYHPEYADTEYEVLLGHLAREILIRRGWLNSDS